MGKLVDVNRQQQPERSLSAICSCSECNSLSCFAKRRQCQPCTCKNCNKPNTCRYYTGQNEDKKSYSDQISAVYLNAARSKVNSEFEELTEHDINYDLERKRLLETNQPPHSLDEYLDRISCVTKTSSKFKHKPSSLSGYIEIISENSEYKKKMNLLKAYVQRLKETKPSNYSEDLTSFENFKNSIYPPSSPQFPEKHRGRCKTRCKGKCKKKEKKYLCLAQAQSAVMSCRQIDHSSETKRCGSQTSNALYNNNNNTACRTMELTTSKESNLLKYDIFNKLKEAYKACSCKVCECIPKFTNKDEICKCKPCECAECKSYTVPQTFSRGRVLSLNLNNKCSKYANQSKLRVLKEHTECYCEPCDCALCCHQSFTIPCDTCKFLIPYQPAEIMFNEINPCTCLPCDCIDCNQRNTAGRVYSEKKIYSCCNPTVSINEIYHHEEAKTSKKIKRDFVAMYAGLPRLNTNVGLKECECLNEFVCKEDTINYIKSSRLFSSDQRTEKTSSVTEEIPVLRKSKNNYDYHCKDYETKRERVHRSTSKICKHASCCTCDFCMRLENKTPLHKCQCTTCRCERCYGHAFIPNYSNIASAYHFKKGDVLTASAHQTKLKIEENKTPATLFHKYSPLYMDLNSNIKPRYDDIDNTPKNLTYQPSLSRQAKRDVGTTLTKSLDRCSILQCDAYVQSKELVIIKPLKNNFTNVPISYSSMSSITRSPSIENDQIIVSVNKKSSHEYINEVMTKPSIEGSEGGSKIDLKLNTDITIPLVKKTISVKQTDFNNIFTKISSLNANNYNALGLEKLNSYVQVPKESEELKSRHIDNCSPELKCNVNSNYKIVTKINIQSDNGNDSLKSDCQSGNIDACTPEFTCNVCSKIKIETKTNLQSDNGNESLKSALGLPKVLGAKCFSDSTLTSLDRMKNDDTEEISHDNLKCFPITQNFYKRISPGYVTDFIKPKAFTSQERIKNDDTERISDDNLKCFPITQNICERILPGYVTDFIKPKAFTSQERIKNDDTERISDDNLKCFPITQNICERILPGYVTDFIKPKAFTSHERIKNDDTERISDDNLECFHMTQNLTKGIFPGYVVDFTKPKEKLPAIMKDNVIDIGDDYKNVRKTLADAKKFSLHLLSLLEMYEKANKEFEKVSDKLKNSYESLFIDKITEKREQYDSEHKNNGANLESNTKFEKNVVHNDTSTNLHLKENTSTAPDHKQTFSNTNVGITHWDDHSKISRKKEFTDLSRGQTNQESPNIEYGILKKVSVVSEKGNECIAHNEFEPCECYDNVQNEQTYSRSKYMTIPEYENTFSTHEVETAVELAHYGNLKEVTKDLRSLENIELVSRTSQTISLDIYGKNIHYSSANKEIETNMFTVSKNSIGCNAKPCSMNKSEGISGFPSLELGLRDTMISAEQTSSNTIKRSHHENKALNQIFLEVKKLLELAILEPLNYLENADDNLAELSTVPTPQSIKFDLKEEVSKYYKEEVSKQKKVPPNNVNKKVSCDSQKLLNEFKKQIRDQLQQVPYTDPLLTRGSNLGSFTSNGECEEQKARFLVVRKVSEHTALVRWNEPRDLKGVKGYELLIDGRTIQKIFNPSKCITAVTCLPHTDKIILTIRTITTTMPESGHYPTATIVYEPRLQ